MVQFFLSGIVETSAGLITVIILAVLLYILFGMGLMMLAGKAGYRFPWLAWIPVGNMFLLARLTISEIRKFTRAFLIVSILEFLAEITCFIFDWYRNAMYPQRFEFNALDLIAGLISIPALCFFLAYFIMYNVFLSQVFKRFMPRQALVFTVLSVIFFFLGPVFLLIAGSHRPNTSLCDEGTYPLQ